MTTLHKLMPALLLATLITSPAAFGRIPATSPVDEADSLMAQTRAALERDAAANPLAIKIELGGRVVPAGDDDGGTYSVPLELRIPLERLTLREEGDAAVGELRLAVAARDRTGRVGSVGEIHVSLRVARDRVAGEDYVFELPVRLPAGKHALALGLADELGETTSFVTRSLKVRRLSPGSESLRYSLPQRTPLGGLTLYQD